MVAALYSGSALLDFDARQLQQSGEHNESATLPLLAEISLSRNGEIPLWNPYMMTGFPHAGDFVNHFWNPVSTLSILAFGGINGMKVSIFLAFIIAGLGQWWFAHVFGLRGLVRLWAALLFMISGGLALLWRLGWYELLLGMVWFPWCFTALWWALHRQDRTSIAVTVLCVAMVLTTGGGYYPFYLLVGLSVLVGLAILFSRSQYRLRKLRRALAIALLSAALLAVMLLPMVDAYRYSVRGAGQDLEQRSSQTIPYSLINYVVSEPAWIDTDILGTANGFNWFYIGVLPLAALVLTAVAISKQRWRRTYMITIGVLLLVLLAWHANRHTPIKYVYDWIPFLYNLRFPNRLLILAASPLIVLAGYGLQYLYQISQRWSDGLAIGLWSSDDRGQDRFRLPLIWVIRTLFFLILALSLRSVYEVNKGLAFAPRPLSEKSFEALAWLKNYDPELYYVDIGGDNIFWGWTPAAYHLEMPVINFVYGRHLTTFDRNYRQAMPFLAEAKYLFLWEGHPVPPEMEFIRDFDGVGLWHNPNAMPFAFGAQSSSLDSSATLNQSSIQPLDVRFDGPNRVLVEAETESAGQKLVVFTSYYPGWQLYVDSRQAPLSPVNDYLGATLQTGNHSYEFVFRPVQHTIGATISLLTAAIIFFLIISDTTWFAQRSARNFRIWNRLRERAADGDTDLGHKRT